MSIVSTIGQKCRRCYSCVRECPAAAIRVLDGQAVVIEERCISCGHCVKVCSQGAKEIKSDIGKVINEIIPGGKAIAIVAPAFAASFPDNFLKLVTGLKKLGFIHVSETAFGADLISREYAKIFEYGSNKNIISSPCPAIYNYIEKYFPNLVPDLAEVVSPMIAMGRYLKENMGNDFQVVFIGPCVAKKFEYIDPFVEDAIDAVLTFVELKELFRQNQIILDELGDSDFDPPHANLGKSFPLTGGLLKTADIPDDVLAKNVIVVDGSKKVQEIIKDIANNKIHSKFIDILFCEGCINGPAIDSDLNYYSKREKVIEFIQRDIHKLDKNVWKSDLNNSKNIKLKRSFKANSQLRPMPTEEKIKEILARTNKFTINDELNCGACGYPTCREYAIAIAKELAEEDMCLPYLIEKIEKAYMDLKETQEQLNSAEKLASIGQLAAGVAHEINNPLGTIMLYASMLKKEVEKSVKQAQSAEDLNLIIEEANRCKNIVANLLNFARQGKLHISDVNVLKLTKEVVKNVQIKPEFADTEIEINDNTFSKVIRGDNDQLKQVFLNLVNNACEAVEESEKKKISIDINLIDEKNILIEVEDSGCGIPEENIKKLFTPFFTTKKMGKGTGLGLAITYGIVKMHKGDIKARSKVGSGTTFSVKLPVNLNYQQSILN
ncbi:MAG: [Fe-Fe] hydrogenase large subunit C-terminal domain-containing protein [Ignavibacteria bacterium]|jgi:signal transduction histidine kinase/iron only hydrogenase large subunit-like protein